MTAKTQIDIGLVLYPGAQLSAVLGLADLFEIADRAARKRPDSDLPRLCVGQWTFDQGNSFRSPPETGNDSDVLILPPTLKAPASAEAARPIAHWLRERHEDGCILASICGGAFLLAETGLLDGRSATTHWTYTETFSSRFPRVTVNTDRLIIDDGDILTAGGLMSWTDVGLKLVDRFLGPTIMMETAQMLLVDPPGREQRYYSSFTPRLNHGDAAILKAQHWLQATGARDTSLTVLAKQAGLEERTFLRRFQKATGLTSSEYAQRLRVGRARERLQFGTLPVDTIAWEVGYSDPATFRKVFRRIVGLTPSEYRQRFHIG